MSHFKIGKNEGIDVIVYLIIAVIVIHFISSLDYSNADFTVVSLFLLIGLISFINIIRSEKNIDIRRTSYIFMFIFFFLAPLQQYTEGVVLWKTTGLYITYSDSDYTYACILVLLTILFFEWGYHSRKWKIRRKSKALRTVIMQENNDHVVYLRQSTNIVLVIVSTIAFLILLATNNIVTKNNVFGNSAIGTQIIHILQYLPVCSLLIGLMYAEMYSTKGKEVYFVILTVEVAILFFPFWGNLSRFLLFGTYIVFLAFFFRDLQLKSFYFLAFFVGYCFAFSNMRYNADILTIFQGTTIDFNHVDYDAFQLLMASIKYVSEEGVLFFGNIISALAFLLPRSIWSGKLEGTGTLIVRLFGSWQENVSAPLIAEFYMAAGVVGVIILSFAAGKISRNLDAWSYSKSYLKRSIFCLITGMAMYIWRGSLLAAFAFTGGLILAVFFINGLCKAK